jgi:hypothetical protein
LFISLAQTPQVQWQAKVTTQKLHQSKAERMNAMDSAEILHSRIDEEGRIISI